MKRTTKIVCTSCGSVGYPQTVTPGYILIEIALWLVFILPGLLYSIWRLSARHQACGVCGQKTIIPVDSPMAQKILVHGLAPGGRAAAPATHHRSG